VSFLQVEEFDIIFENWVENLLKNIPQKKLDYQPLNNYYLKRRIKYYLSKYIYKTPQTCFFCKLVYWKARGNPHLM